MGEKMITDMLLVVTWLFCFFGLTSYVLYMNWQVSKDLKRVKKRIKHTLDIVNNGWKKKMKLERTNYKECRESIFRPNYIVVNPFFAILNGLVRIFTLFHYQLEMPKKWIIRVNNGWLLNGVGLVVLFWHACIDDELHHCFAVAGFT